MYYKLSDIESQIIATLQAQSGLTPAEGIQVKAHSGEISEMTFSVLNGKGLEGFVHLFPFVYVQYIGRRVTEETEDYSTYYHKLKFRMYVGASSLREKLEAKNNAYTLLAAVYDALHGKFPLSTTQTLSPLAPVLSGQAITTPFNAMTPLRQAEGDMERLILSDNNKVIYQTDMQIDLVT